MTEVVFHIGLAVWWSLAACFFGILVADADDPREAICTAALWPLFVVLYLPVILWRTSFRTAKTIRTDLKNRGLLQEFEEWRKGRVLPKDEGAEADDGR